MSDSDTSSELNVKVYDKKGKISENLTENKKTTDTDMYFNLIANQEKVLPEPNEKTTSSELVNSESESKKETSSVESSSSSSSSSSSNKSRRSKDRFETVHFGGSNDVKFGTSTPMPPPQNSTSNSNFKPSFSSGPSVPTVTAQLSPQEMRMKKIELLRKLSEIKQKGFALTKDYDFTSSIEEMEYEYELLKSFVDKRNGIKLYKNILLNGVGLVEFLNEKYDPFDFHLEGWGDHMQVEVDSYDDVLEELYEKYKGTGKSMPPEIKLVLLLVASGSAYHFSRSQSTIPGLDAVLNKNPELISKLINPQKPKSNFRTAQEINIDNQRAALQQREKELKQKLQQARMQQQTQQQTQPRQQMQQPTNLFGNMFPGQQQNQQVQQQPQQQQRQQPNYMNAPNMPVPKPNVMMEPEPANQSRNKILASGTPEIRAPDNVKEILERIRRTTSLAGTTDTQDDSSSNNDRIVSDKNLSESKRGRKPKAAPSISISTK
jgi:hypothetical protein